MSKFRSIIRQMVNESLENNQIVKGEYLTLFFKPNSLKIQLTEEGRIVLEDVINDNNGNVYSGEEKMYDLFEDISSNSSISFDDNLGKSGFGLTDAPGVVNTLETDENGDVIESDVYYYNNYMVESFVEEMLKKGYVVFDKA